MAGLVHERDDVRMDDLGVVIDDRVMCGWSGHPLQKNELFILTFALSELLEHEGWMDGAIHSSWIGTTCAEIRCARCLTNLDVSSRLALEDVYL